MLVSGDVGVGKVEISGKSFTEPGSIIQSSCTVHEGLCSSLYGVREMMGFRVIDTRNVWDDYFWFESIRGAADEDSVTEDCQVLLNLSDSSTMFGLDVIKVGRK